MGSDTVMYSAIVNSHYHGYWVSDTNTGNTHARCLAMDGKFCITAGLDTRTARIRSSRLKVPVINRVGYLVDTLA